MIQRCRLPLLVITTSLGIALVPLPAAENTESNSNLVHIGMVHSLFPSMSEAFLKPVLESFGALMQTQTGVPGQIRAVQEPLQLGQMLADGKVKLGVFNGIEYGWAKERHPRLTPLMIAVNQDRYLQAFFVVRGDVDASDIGSLKGKTLAVSANMRHHCNVFLDRRCQALGQTSAQLFGKVTTLPNAEKAIDQVVDGKADCTLVDKTSFTCYQRLKPVRHAKLKMLEQSPVFPAAVIVYNPDTLDEATRTKFRKGLIDANKSIQGKHMMSLFKLTAFEPAPADYDQVVSGVVSTYPAPDRTQAVKQNEANN